MANARSDSWPFRAPWNAAVFTVRQILRDGAPILLVCHEEGDGGWQFLTGEQVNMEDAMLVGLEEMVRHDPSLLQLADLPEGWQAARAGLTDAWSRRPLPLPETASDS